MHSHAKAAKLIRKACLTQAGCKILRKQSFVTLCPSVFVASVFFFLFTRNVNDERSFLPQLKYLPIGTNLKSKIVNQICCN